jgi:tetratricopeptide (TPR) repeat protein
VATLALEASGRDIEVLFQHAAGNLLAGDIDGYRRLCQEGKKRYHASPHPRHAYLLARMFCLERGASVGEKEVRGWVDKALADQPDAMHHLHTLGLFEYQAGQYDEAIQAYRRSMAAWPGWPGMAANWLGLAAAYRRKGEEAEARQWLERYREDVAKVPLDARIRIHPHDRAACWLLLREAEKDRNGEDKGRAQPRGG